MTTTTLSCKTCGRDFEARVDRFGEPVRVVNCPDCRRSRRERSTLTGDDWARDELRKLDERFARAGHNDGLAGREMNPRGAARESYVRAYESALRERDDLEREYRELYWERNELQTIGSDAPDQAYLNAEIDRVSKKIERIVRTLGYMPQA